ncbi:glycosyl hydrolase [Streptomyces sp. NPDC002514]|uniref:glycosyl hydrolase n=1 Tax=Streptomyces sp. NPDC001270 TaxID=3364554 RepID=UPI003699AEB3
MRRRTSFLLAFLLVIVGVSGTTWAIQSQRSDNTKINSKSAADVGGADHTVTFENRTDGRIWVGSTVNADGSAAITGLPTLEPGQSATITIPEHAGAGHWRGTFFARQGCAGESGSTFHCAVGDCGPFVDHCSTGEQPTGLAEFNFDPADSLAPWYDVSYVNAVATPVTITPNDVPVPETGSCAQAGCADDLLSSCPADNLQKDGSGKPLVCVNPNRDAKTPYSDNVNQKCPKAYAWSKQDAEQGNKVMYQCTQCNGMTVAFGNGSTQPPAESDPPAQQPAPPAQPVNSGRKGISLNPVDGASEALADSKASWYYNWDAAPGPVTAPPGVEFVPMIWGEGSIVDAKLGQANKYGKELLGFNEPDNPGQSNLTVDRALTLWGWMSITHMRLGAPAVSYGADVPGGWLDQFMQGVQQRGLPQVDFIPLHWYGGDFGPDATNQLRDYLQRVWDRYHKPIWLTEYGLTDFSSGTPRYPSEQQQVDFIKSSTQMLDSLPFVERYAWFTLSTQTAPTGLYNGTTPNASGQAYRDAN